MVRTILILAVIVFVASTRWVAAETKACIDRETAIRHLEGKFSEAPAALGLTNTGEILEVFTSDAGRSWTMLVTTPDGNTCLVATGEAWKSVPAIAALDYGF